MTDEFQQGHVIGERYRVLGTLGRGGMATVYLAEDLTLGRRVAIKVLHRKFAEDAKFVERFRREAKAAAGLNHPNVVGVYDWGSIGAQNYIVMEYVHGETLKDRIRRQGRLEPREAAAIGTELLSALGAAHARGIIHRDVKSQNILLDDEGRVKVADFGIAQAGDPSMTEAGSILGTAQYLAPEQARGEPVDERSDLYSVGVVLYEMLTGTVPFKGDSSVTVALKHVNERAPEPVEFVPTLPYQFNQIVLKALAKDPSQRYANAAEFAADLHAAVTGGPVLAAAYDPSLSPTQVVGATLAAEGATRVMTARDRAAARATTSPARDRGRRKKRPPWWLWLLIALAAVAFIVAGIFIVRAISGGGSVVPRVVGLEQAAATSRLQAAGFTVKVDTGYSDDYEEGVVYDQQPKPQTELREGGTVEIWVSQGPTTVELPDFSGETPEAVEKWLADNDLQAERKTGQNAEVERGLVYQTKPGAGESAKRGSTVTYWVSSGVRQVEVPDLSGMSVDNAAAALQAVGLELGSTSEQESTEVPAGVVMGQDPGAGTSVDRGTAVNILVSSGPPAPPEVEVPTVVTMNEATARATLEGQGFTVVVVYVSGGEPAGTVVSQTPAGGTMALEGSEVTIEVDND